MKRSIVLILGLIFATISSASVIHSTDIKCREGLAKFNKKISLEAQVEKDLLQGIWIQGSEDDFQTMAQFTEDGKATFLHAEKAGSVYKEGHFNWQVIVLNDDPILILEHPRAEQSKQLLVEQTCQGINLVNTETGRIQSFRYIPAHPERQSQKKLALKGRWENILPSVTLQDNCSDEASGEVYMEKVTFRFEFRENGTFTRLLSSRTSELRFEEEGHWEISGDGKNLLLHCNDPNGNKLTQRIKIKYLEMDELVLEQPLAIVGKQFASVKDSFFFNKQ